MRVSELKVNFKISAASDPPPVSCSLEMKAETVWSLEETGPGTGAPGFETSLVLLPFVAALFLCTSPVRRRGQAWGCFGGPARG